MKILVVGNEPDCRKILLKAGFKVDFAEDGERALELVKESSPDLILSNADLPEMNGLILFQHIRENPETRFIPFVLMGQLEEEERIRAMESGVDDYIPKPFQTEELIARIRLILEEAKAIEPPVGKGFSGRLREMNLVDLIQTLELGKKTGVLSLKRDRKQGQVFFQNGEVIDAASDGLQGEEALYRMFTWTEGDFLVEFKPIDRHGTIKATNQELISEGMKMLGEWEDLKAKLPPLSAVLELIYKPEERELSPEEELLLELFNGQRSIAEVIEASGIDDLRALRFISECLQKGCLKETLIFLERDGKMNQRGVQKPAKAPASVHERILSLFTGLFKKTPGSEVSEPEKPEGGREEGIIRNKIPLSKNELLLIREKLR